MLPAIKKEMEQAFRAYNRHCIFLRFGVPFPFSGSQWGLRAWGFSAVPKVIQSSYPSTLPRFERRRCRLFPGVFICPSPQGVLLELPPPLGQCLLCAHSGDHGADLSVVRYLYVLVEAHKAERGLVLRLCLPASQARGKIITVIVFIVFSLLLFQLFFVSAPCGCRRLED